MTNTVKCRIKMYDPAVTEPPLKFITLGEFTCEEKYTNDDGGVSFASLLMRKCSEQGYDFKFYSMSSEDGYDYDITVRG